MRKFFFGIVVIMILSEGLFAQDIIELGKLGGFHSIQRVRYRNGVVFLLDEFSLITVDVTEPSSPRILDSIDLDDWALSLDLTDSIAFVGYGSNVAVIKCFDPSNLVFVTSYPTTHYAYDLRCRNNFIYIANFLRFLILRFDGLLSYAGSIVTAGQNKAVDLNGSYAYLGEDQMGFYIVQIDDPSMPVPISYVDTPGWCVGIRVSGQYAYVADASIIGVPNQASVQIIRVDDPFNPTIVGSYISYGGNAFNVFPVRTDYLIVADGVGGIKLLSLFNPSSPTLLTSVSGIGTVRDVVYWDNRIYAACEETLRIFSCELGSPVIPDTIPPEARLLIPADGSYSSCLFQQIRILITDNTSVDFNSISLEVNGVIYTRGSPNLSFRGDTLIWTSSIPFSSGSRVNGALLSLSDTASNSARGLPMRFSFTIDLAPPVILDPYPPNGSSITNLQPEISVTIFDSLSGVDESRLYVELNGIPISRFTYAENRLRFVPFSPFSEYDTVEVCLISISDRARYCGANLVSSYCWEFYTIPAISEEDTVPPIVWVIFPPQNMYSSCPRQFVRFGIIENTMIDPYSIELEANGVSFSFPSSSVILGNDTLIFQPPYEWDEGLCTVELVSISDTAGNEPDELPISVSFFVDYTSPVISSPFPLPWSSVTDTIVEISVSIVDNLSGLDQSSPRVIINGVEHTGYTYDGERLRYLYRVSPGDSVARVCIRNAQDRAWGCGPNIAPEFCWAFFVNTYIKDKNELPLFIGTPYPNPFNDFSIIPFRLPLGAELGIQIYDVQGTLIKSETVNVGSQSFIRVDLPANAHSGLYLYKIVTSKGLTSTGKLIYIR